MDCDSIYAHEAMDSSCPECGSYRWISPPEGKVHVMQCRKPYIREEADMDFEQLEKTLTGDAEPFTISADPNKSPNIMDVLQAIALEVLRIKQQVQEMQNVETEERYEDETAGSS